MKLQELIEMHSNLKIIKSDSFTGQAKLTKNQMLLKIREIVKQGITRDIPDDKIIIRIKKFLDRYIIRDSDLKDKVDIFMRDKLKLVNQNNRGKNYWSILLKVKEVWERV